MPAHNSSFTPVWCWWSACDTLLSCAGWHVLPRASCARRPREPPARRPADIAPNGTLAFLPPRALRPGDTLTVSLTDAAACLLCVRPGAAHLACRPPQLPFNVSGAAVEPYVLAVALTLNGNAYTVRLAQFCQVTVRATGRGLTPLPAAIR